MTSPDRPTPRRRNAPRAACVCARRGGGAGARAGLLAAAAAAGACDGDPAAGDPAVYLHVIVDWPATVAGVESLQIRAEADGSDAGDTRELPPGASDACQERDLPLDRCVDFSVTATGRQGPVELRLRALDRDDRLVGQAAESVPLDPCAALSRPPDCFAVPSCEWDSGKRLCRPLAAERRVLEVRVTLDTADFQVNDRYGGAQFLGYVALAGGEDDPCPREGRFGSGGRAVAAAGADGGEFFVTVWEDDCPELECDDICDYCWFNTESEDMCPEAKWNGTGDGCDCGCQFLDADCPGIPRDPDPAQACDVWARRLSRDGRPAGKQFPVSRENAPDRRAVIAAQPDGSFAVAWQAPTGVKARLFSPESQPLALPFPAAREVGSDPDLAAIDGGGYALAWIEEGARVQVCRIPAAGGCVGTDEATGARDIAGAALAAGPAGALVVWTERAGGGELWARAALVAEAGLSWSGDAFQLVTGEASACQPDVAALEDSFLVAFTASARTCGGADPDSEVALARVWPDRTQCALYPAPAEQCTFAIPGEGQGLARSHPSVAALGGGRALLAWETHDVRDPDDGAGVRAAIVAVEDGAVVEDDIVINTTVTSGQCHAAAAALGGGRAVVVFQDGSAAGPDADAAGIRARIVE